MTCPDTDYGLFNINQKRKRNTLSRSEIRDGSGNVVKTYMENEFGRNHAGLKTALAMLVHSAEAQMRNEVDFEVYFDEIAIMFGSTEAAQQFISEIVMEPTFEHFNAAMDIVATEPIQSDYRVRYDFLRVVDEPFRVECMALTEGVSPLHAPVQDRLERSDYGTFLPVHLSFKVGSEENYEEACISLESKGFTMAQSCRSAYGVFSYWKHPAIGLYVKPRVNLRDAR